MWPSVLLAIVNAEDEGDSAADVVTDAADAADVEDEGDAAEGLSDALTVGRPVTSETLTDVGKPDVPGVSATVAIVTASVINPMALRKSVC